nr:MAG TPA: nucleoside triphosphate pyrophosphohydrolase [Caudoviricetes sp.]
MGFDVDSDVVEKVIAFYGVNYMENVAREEPAELIHAICRVCRYLDPEDDEVGKENRSYLLYNLAEEMADTLIIISELQAIWGIDDCTIQDIIDFKQARTKKRIAEDWRTK